MVMVEQQSHLEKDTSKIEIVDDFSSLIEIYDKNPEEREEIIRNNFEGCDRIGFGKTSLQEYIDLIHEHFLTHTKEYLEDEKAFLIKFHEINLDKFVTDSIIKSKNLFPEDLTLPTTVFLLNGDYTDGKVIGDGKFGINLNNFFRIHYDGTQRKVDFNTLLKDIQGTISHESVHCFCEQLSWRKEQKSGLVGIAFEEGLATLVEDSHRPNHDRYLDEFVFWKDILKKVASADGHENYAQILKSIKDNKNLNEFNPRAVSLIEGQLSEGDEITEKEFDYLITKSVIKLNGPIYHVGFKLWSDIFEKEGLEGIKRRILVGPKSFEELFT